MRMMTRRGAVGIILGSFLVLQGAPAGCTTGAKKEGVGPAVVKTSQRSQGGDANGQSTRLVRGAVGDRPNELTDPCAGRLHDLSGLLLMYYALKKEMPATLEELAPLADGEFTPACPASGRPYVYVPQGLQSASAGERSLILYDAAPAHRGLRWGIFVAPPREGQPPATWVILMSDEVFRGFVARDATQDDRGR